MEEWWSTSASPPPMQVLNNCLSIFDNFSFLFKLFLDFSDVNLTFSLSTFVTCLSEPLDPPQNVTFTNVTASSVTFLWQPPTEPNGIIVHYTIYYSDNNTITEQVRRTYFILNTEKGHKWKSPCACMSGNVCDLRIRWRPNQSWNRVTIEHDSNWRLISVSASCVKYLTNTNWILT